MLGVWALDWLSGKVNCLWISRNEQSLGGAVASESAKPQSQSISMENMLNTITYRKST